MKELFFTAQTAIPPGVGFPYYGTVHLLWLLAISGICCCTACLLRRQEAAVRHRCLLLFCVAGLLLEAGKLLLLGATSQFRWHDLPLDLCDLALFVYPAAILWNRPLLKEWMYSLNLPGTCLALLFPNWNPLPPWNAFTILAFSMHGLLLLVPICMLASRDLQPSAKRLPACLLSLLLACIPISLVNRQLGTNFFFLARPSRNSPLSWAAQYLGNPGYLLIIPGLIALIWGILYGVPAGVHAVARKVRRK